MTVRRGCQNTRDAWWGGVGVPCQMTPCRHCGHWQAPTSTDKLPRALASYQGTGKHWQATKVVSGNALCPILVATRSHLRVWLFRSRRRANLAPVFVYVVGVFLTCMAEQHTRTHTKHHAAHQIPIVRLSWCTRARVVVSCAWQNSTHICTHTTGTPKPQGQVGHAGERDELVPSLRSVSSSSRAATAGAQHSVQQAVEVAEAYRRQ